MEPMTELELSLAQEAVKTFQGHVPTGFACCTAHPAAEATGRLLTEITRLQAELAAFAGHVNLLEAKLCTCEPVREHADYTRPAFYQHTPDCQITRLFQS